MMALVFHEMSHDVFEGCHRSSCDVFVLSHDIL